MVTRMCIKGLDVTNGASVGDVSCMVITDEQTAKAGIIGFYGVQNTAIQVLLLLYLTNSSQATCEGEGEYVRRIPAFLFKELPPTCDW